MKRSMVAFLIQLFCAFRSRFTRRARLEAENLLLRQQLVVLQRKSQKRVRLWNIDRLLLVWLYRLYPSLLDAIIIVQPETVIRWHRRGFRAYWRWKSRHVGHENPLWGAPRIHGELLMLGIEVAESTVGRIWSGAAGHRRMDRRSGDGRFPLGRRAASSDSRPRRGLRPSLHPSHSNNGYPRSSDRVTLTVAERLRRAPHRLDPARKPRSLGRVRRSALASRSEELRFLLQSGPNASLAAFSALTEARPHRGHLNSGWAASPICQGLGFD
jgi:hypothetical protein